MMNRLVRPCTHEAFNDNEAFEAIGAVVSIVEGGTSNGVQQFAVKLDLANGHSEELDFENRGRAYYTYQSALLAIYEALNAPVLTTKEVLAGLPKDAKALAYFVYHGSGDDAIDEWREAKWDDMYEKWKYNSFGIFPVINRDDDSWYILKSNGCSKTLDYLLQFTLQGVRIKEGG